MEKNSILRDLCTEVRTSSGYFKGKKLYVQDMSRGKKVLVMTYCKEEMTSSASFQGKKRHVLDVLPATENHVENVLQERKNIY